MTKPTKFRLVLCELLIIAFFSASSLAAPLRMYFIDVEGGQATLMVAPSGKSLLIDTGWPGFEGRDATRIAAAAKEAGISAIDYLVITHYHGDHVGGVVQLKEKIKVGAFVDHGPNREDSDNARANYAAYEKAVDGAKRVIVKPGDQIPIEGLGVRVVSADGEVIKTSTGDHDPQRKTLCSSETNVENDPTENARSVGLLITYGKLRILDLGDLTNKKELQLTCPANFLGNVDLLVVSHHGGNQSNAPALVYALRPRVAIMNNGAQKGASPDVGKTIHDSPGLDGLGQLHYAVSNGKEQNVAPDCIANLDEKCAGKSIKVVADDAGAITVTNTRNGFAKTYRK